MAMKINWLIMARALCSLLLLCSIAPAEEPSQSSKPKESAVSVNGAGEAERLATKLREVMLKFDSAVEAKAASEEKFYLDQQRTLRSLWMPGDIPTNDDKGTLTLEIKRRIQKSIPYVSITINARRTARD